MLRDDWIFRRGDIYLADLNPFFGSEQGGTRPVLVLQNNTGNYYCPTLIVAPIPLSHAIDLPADALVSFDGGDEGVHGTAIYIDEQGFHFLDGWTPSSGRSGSAPFAWKEVHNET